MWFSHLSSLLLGFHAGSETKLANTCIGSLYDKDETGVKRHCKFERKPFMETVFQVGPNNFVVFSPEQFTARFSCRTGSSTANVAYANRIILDSGCSLELQNHLLHSTNHFTLHDDTEISTWDWDPLTAPAASLTDFTHVVEEVNEIRSSEWFKERIDDHFQKDFLPDHSPLEKIIIMMASIVSMIVAGVITYLMKFVKSWLEVKYREWLTTVAENHATRQPPGPCPAGADSTTTTQAGSTAGTLPSRGLQDQPRDATHPTLKKTSEFYKFLIMMGRLYAYCPIVIA